MISTSGIHRGGRADSQKPGFLASLGMTSIEARRNKVFAALRGTQLYASSVVAGKIAARDDTEDKKLRKELLTAGGPCFEGTLRKALFLRISSSNEVPWPGQLRTSYDAL
jgi:hypothetical protein